jgi:hypothetical protein
MSGAGLTLSSATSSVERIRRDDLPL